MRSIEVIATRLEEVRKKNAIVHHITNNVTINDCANVTLAIGASPIMADAEEEIEEISSITASLLLNIGTLTGRTIKSMVLAAKYAEKNNIPITLDPVGLGASKLRTKAIEDILAAAQVHVIRGNLSEISYLYNPTTKSKGVDVSPEDAKRTIDESIVIAKKCAQRYACVVAISGAVDVISDGERVFCIHNGHPMLSKITGTGCMSSSLIASLYTSTEPSLENSCIAAIAGLLIMGTAGESAYLQAGDKGNASFHNALLDAISMTQGRDLINKTRLQER